LTVEITIRFATNQDTPLVVLLDVGVAIKVRIAIDLGEPALSVVATPDVRAAIAVPIARQHLLMRWPDLDRSDSGERQRAEQRDDPGGERFHESTFEIRVPLTGGDDLASRDPRFTTAATRAEVTALLL